MPKYDDPVERHRLEREARELAARKAARIEWPPPPISDPRPGAGNPRSLSPMPLEKAHKSVTAVWGIVATLAAAVTLGWSAHAFLTKPLVSEAVADGNKPLLEKIELLRKEQELNQRANEATFAGIATDITWLKRERKVIESEPIKAPHR